MQFRSSSYHQSSVTSSTQFDAAISKLEVVAEQEEKPDALYLNQQDPSIWQIRSELDGAIAKLSPLERQQLAQKLCCKLNEIGLDWGKIKLSTQLPEAMSTQEISQLAAYTYEFNSEIFQAVFLEKPQLIQSLSDTLVTAIVGILATKWIHGHSAQP